jgi:catechol 2,3-dioxygenase-like lactoylglutathione lyase family enzyme
VPSVEEFVAPKIAQVTIDTTNARASAEFWRRLLGLVYRTGHEPPESEKDDEAGRDWLNLLTPSGSACLAFQNVESLEHTTWPQPDVPQQLHLDLTVSDRVNLDRVGRRILELGGELKLDRSDSKEEPLRVYADPDGHTFCVFVATGE